MKCPWIGFSFHFSFLSAALRFLKSPTDSSYKSFAALISHSLLFSTYYFKPSTEFSTHSSMEIIPFPPSFLPTYNLSTLSFGWKALCIVRSFLVLLSIAFSSSTVLSRKGAEYLIRDIAQVLTPIIRFLLFNFKFPVLSSLGENILY